MARLEMVAYKSVCYHDVWIDEKIKGNKKRVRQMLIEQVQKEN